MVLERWYLDQTVQEASRSSSGRGQVILEGDRTFLQDGTALAFFQLAL